MGTEAIECYYCAWATDDLQTYINHVVKAHGEKLLKCKTPALDEKSGTMADSSQFSPLTTLSEQLGPNSWVSSVFIPAFIANIGKHFFLKYDYQNSKSI